MVKFTMVCSYCLARWTEIIIISMSAVTRNVCAGIVVYLTVSHPFQGLCVRPQISLLMRPAFKPSSIPFID